MNGVDVRVDFNDSYSYSNPIQNGRYDIFMAASIIIFIAKTMKAIVDNVDELQTELVGIMSAKIDPHPKRTANSCSLLVATCLS